MTYYEIKMDLDQIYAYSNFLKKSSDYELQVIESIIKANQFLQTTMTDNLILDIDTRMNNLKRIFSNFSKEMEIFSKKMSKMYGLYSEYSKKLN